MTCSGRYAEAWQFAAFWCASNLLQGLHAGAGPGDAALSDTYTDFISRGVKANVGMVLYNTTQGTSGVVTAVTTHTLTAVGVTWDNADAYRIATLTGEEIATTNHYLDIASGNIHAALGSVGGCDCTLADWATGTEGMLTKINIIETAAFHTCPCMRPLITDDMRRTYLEESNRQLSMIRTGEIELCAGYTGSKYPAFGAIEQAFNVFSAEQIIINREKRNRG